MVKVPGTFFIAKLLFSYQSMRTPNIVVVSGVGRSGTTAVLNTIGSAPGYISYGTETPLLRCFAQLWMKISQHRDYNMSTTNFSDQDLKIRIKKSFFDTALYPDGGLRFVLKNILLNMWQLGLLLKAKTIVLQCNLDEDEFDAVNELFPGSKFVYVIRNPIDTVLSRQGFPGFSGESIHDSCNAWSSINRTLSYLIEKPNCITLKHEEFLSSSTVADLERFLGISSKHWINSLRKNIFHPTRNHWRRSSLDASNGQTLHPQDVEDQIQLARTLMRHEAAKFGYDNI